MTAWLVVAGVLVVALVVYLGIALLDPERLS